MVSDTKPLGVKCCSKCDETKETDKFMKNRNICKECRNKGSREKYKDIAVIQLNTINCNTCKTIKPFSSFYKGRTTCKECISEKRRKKYDEDEEHRLKLIKMASTFKHDKVVERQNKKLEEIGEGNKKCSHCNTIKAESNFRYNRLKCRICERDEPLDKFKRIVRGRIHSALTKKTMHTVKYLGATSDEYLQWILHNDKNYTLENRGKEWHIDHVIPLYWFNLENEEEQLIAFNWRNTMPLSAKENLSKNSKIIIPQIEQHLEKLKEYHLENKLDLPQVFIDLFAKYLVDGKPLKSSLPL